MILPNQKEVTKLRDEIKRFVKKQEILFHLFRKPYVYYNKNYKITFRHYHRQHQIIANDLKREIKKILCFCTDIEFEFYVKQFEKRFAKLCNVKFSSGTSSGTSALQLSLTALGIGPGDEVITIPNTYISTALAISNTGAKPVFVDVDKRMFNMDIDRIEKVITEKTKAILPVHLYGQMTNMKPLMKIAKKYKLKVIEDAAQAFGSEYYGKKAGSMGDVGCFSFFTSKNLSGLGNGGVIVSNNKALIQRIELLKNPESNHSDLILSKRTPGGLDAIQVAIITAKLPHIKRWLNFRRKFAYVYNQTLQSSSVMLPLENKNFKHSYCSYVIRTKRRDKLRKFLRKHRIETEIEFSPPVHLTKTFQYLGYKHGDFPITEEINNEILSLPISPFLKKNELVKICKVIKKWSCKQKES